MCGSLLQRRRWSGESFARFFASNQLFAGDDVASVVNGGCANGALVFGMGVRGESAGPGDVAMASRIEGVAALGEGPARAGVEFAEGEVVGSDVLLGAGKTL